MEQPNIFDLGATEGFDFSTLEDDNVSPAMYGTSQHNPLHVEHAYLPSMQGPLQYLVGSSMNSDLTSPFLSPGAQSPYGGMSSSHEDLEEVLEGLPTDVQEFNQKYPHLAHLTSNTNIGGSQQINQSVHNNIMNMNGAAHASSGQQQVNQPVHNNTMTMNGAAPASSGLQQFPQPLYNNFNGAVFPQVSQALDTNFHQTSNAQQYQPVNAQQYQPVNAQQHQLVNAQQQQPVNAHQYINADQSTHSNIFRQDPQVLYHEMSSSQATASSFQVPSASSREGETQASITRYPAFPSGFSSGDPHPSSPVQIRKRKRAASNQGIGQEASSTPAATPSSSPTPSHSPASSQDYAQASDFDASTSDNDAPVSKKPRRARKSQGGAKGKGYADDLEGRPPTDARPPAGVVIGAIEILAFFPRWLQHPSVVLRLLKAGWTRQEMAKAKLHAINGLNDFYTFKKVFNRVQKQVSVGGTLKTGLGSWSNKNLWMVPDSDDLTGDGWETRNDLDSDHAATNWTDYKLADIAAPAMQGGNLPQGADRLFMTQVLEYAYRHPERNLTLADTQRIIDEQNFTAPGPLNKDHDAQAFHRVKNSISAPPEPEDTKDARIVMQNKSRAKTKAKRDAMGGQ